MFDKMKQLMEMKKQADKIKRELDAVQVEINAVNGINVVVNGSQDFKSITVDEALLNGGNKSKLEADLLRSINAAIKKSQQLAAEKMKDAMPGFPGM